MNTFILFMMVILALVLYIICIFLKTILSLLLGGIEALESVLSPAVLLGLILAALCIIIVVIDLGSVDNVLLFLMAISIAVVLCGGVIAVAIPIVGIVVSGLISMFGILLQALDGGLVVLGNLTEKGYISLLSSIAKRIDKC